MPHAPKSPRPRWIAPIAVALAGLALLWTMWLSGGSFWAEQRPFMAVTLISAAALVAILMIAVALPRGSLRLLMSLLAVIALLATFLGESAENLVFVGGLDIFRQVVAKKAGGVIEREAESTDLCVELLEGEVAGFQINGGVNGFRDYGTNKITKVGNEYAPD